MRMTVLASGSKGNSTVIASPNTTILVRPRKDAFLDWYVGNFKK